MNSIMIKISIVGSIFALSLGFVVFSYASADLTQILSGKILIDVQNNGEAWYVNPLTRERYYLGRPDDAYAMMRIFGLGISNMDLAKIPEVGSPQVGDRRLRERLSGRILLQIEEHGEAWYIDPVSLQRHYLGTAKDAFRIMQELGLGISSEELNTIEDGGSITASSDQNVPFTAQAPKGDWSDLRQNEGCEEASVFMAMHWVYGTTFSTEDALNTILDMSDWEKLVYGSFVDTSARDTVDRLFKQYYRYDGVTVRYNISPADIRHELAKGNLVLVPADGTIFLNPNFRSHPERHMFVIKGFDWTTGEFITNEPGTRFGENYRYGYQTIRASLRDYRSGTYIPIPDDSPSAMIIVSKS